MATAALCLFGLTACGGTGGPVAPKGWHELAKDANGTTYADPADDRRTLTVSAATPYDGTLKDLSTRLTIDAVLHEPRTKLERATTFEPCPGEAGLLIFRRSTTPPKAMEIAFTQWNGKAVSATYRGPAGAPPGDAVIAAMRSAVCSS